ncbi:probable Ammonia transport outward protein 2 [Saccharomycodes ludwigii]|uniref:Probable Ammonia transport outward protein 2 n=1 Tax=Saccharomycodes ludwigii TaxID=36035 RepID=A0A376B183_9ASCO|nr:hypothetical protein SCDLUD_003445 [Saccharomycodes ludwigii]KAH3900462.1 hypothetical protein SCDLUD_003445 [Saccharomycodes ludwigii]SSD58244.1 probable Ammonia transport outward protein 2 [Saccharomycodes ludwigii]
MASSDSDRSINQNTDYEKIYNNNNNNQRANNTEDVAGLNDEVIDHPISYNNPQSYYSKTNDEEDLRSSVSNDIQKITTGGKNNEYIYIGRQKFLRDDLYQAFGGTLNPGLAPESTHKFANPAPLGLSAFALTTFVLSMCNARAMGITISNVVVGLAIFYGGLVQIIAGIWEIAVENTFGGTALASFGGFWMSFGAINIPWFGIIDAYSGHEEQLTDALGFYLLGWAIFTYGLSLCTMKATVMFFALFFLLATTFLLLSIGNFADSVGCIRAGGVVGVIVAFIAWYNAFAGVANRENSYVIVRTIQLPSNERTLL